MCLRERERERVCVCMCVWCSVDEDVGEMDFEKNQLKLVPCRIHEGLAD